VNVVEQLLQMIPRLAEPLEAAHVGSMEHPGLQVHGDHPRGSPFAAASGHWCPRTQMIHDVPQRIRGLQDVVDGAEQRGIRGDRDLGVLGPRLHYRDVTPAFARDALARYCRHLG
jgi:hypothetical protein